MTHLRTQTHRNRRYRLLLNAGVGNGNSEGPDLSAWGTTVEIGSNIIATSLTASGGWLNAAETALYFCTDSGDKIVKFDLSVAGDLTSGVIDTGNETGDIGRPWGVWLNADEDKVIVAQSTAIQEYDLETPGDLTSLSSVVNSIDTSGIYTTGRALCMNWDGTELYSTAITTKNIVHWSLGTAYDLSTAVVEASYDAETPLEITGNGACYGVALDPSGTKLYVADGGASGAETLHQYDLAGTYDIEAMTKNDDQLVITASDPWGLFIQPLGDGTRMYMMKVAGGDSVIALDTA